MIERAKTNAKAMGIKTASADGNPSSDDADSEIDQLVGRAYSLMEQEELGKEIQKKAAVDRECNLAIAKLLAALDVFSEVSR
jgi:hypothetical protein